MIRSTWRLPLAGGTNISIRSLNAISPTRSLFAVAENASVAATSAARSRFVTRVVVTADDPLRSTSSITVSSRSSTYVFTYGVPIRAVTFQSIERTSSPGSYCRTSENSMPRPRNTLWYSPRNTLATSRRARISMRRTRVMRSAGDGRAVPGIRIRRSIR